MMRIAILGSVALPVPPPAQGGTEWIAYYQAKGLAEKGHQVILFAARGSKKNDLYELVEAGGGDMFRAGEVSDSITRSLKTPRGWQADPPAGGEAMIPPTVKGSEIVESSRPLRKENVYLSQVIEKLLYRKDDYDLILNNMRGEAVFLPVAKMLGKPFVNVTHLPLFNELASLFKTYNTSIITISNAQRKNFPDLNYLATVNNCVDTEKYVFNLQPSVIPSDPPAGGESRNLTRRSLDFETHHTVRPFARDDKEKNDYLLMMGTIGRHKNQAGAIEIAKNTGMNLVLAGKIRDQDYYKGLQKDIDGESVRWVGELGFEEKLELYQNAKAFIFPILWQEPFGLVMIEAMAAGTPVVAFGNGAVPEVVADGVTGFVVEPEEILRPEGLRMTGGKYSSSHLRIKKKGIDGLVEAVTRINAMSPEEYRQMRINCRKHVEENFTVEKMVKNYEEALLRIEKTIAPRYYS